MYMLAHICDEAYFIVAYHDHDIISSYCPELIISVLTVCVDFPPFLAFRVSVLGMLSQLW